MSFNWPNHPLYDQLCKKASDKIPSLGFVVKERTAGTTSFISKDDLTVTIQHGGYDMPYVLFGYKSNKPEIGSWVLLEYYIDKMTPIYEKHVELKSFYDFEYDFDLLSNHYDKILSMVKKPKTYLEWQQGIDIEKIFKELKK
jgi:hypothetical protein